jgi:hypothetical protein
MIPESGLNLKWKLMNKVKRRALKGLALWLAGAVICGVIDRMRQSTILLSLYWPIAAIAAVLAMRKHRTRNYKFEYGETGVVSPLGFEVRASNSHLEYIERDHVVSWKAQPESGSVGRLKLSESEIKGWDEPFANEPMTNEKKREIFRAVASALVYRELVEEGKIHPKKG